VKTHTTLILITLLVICSQPAASKWPRRLPVEARRWLVCLWSQELEGASLPIAALHYHHPLTAHPLPQVRYFMLKDGVLSYYGDKKEAQDPKLQPKGSFHVLSITSIKTMPHKDKKFQNQAPPAPSRWLAATATCNSSAANNNPCRSAVPPLIAEC
jgi:hypothetical protein